MRPLKILLLNIPNLNEIEGNDPPILKKCGGIYPPLGLMYVASYLKEFTNHDVGLFDCQAFDIDYDELELWLRNTPFDIIGLSSITLGLVDLQKTIQIIKKVCNAKIVIGGPHATIYPEETMKLGADSVVVGEGEHAFIDAIQKDGIHIGNRVDDLDMLPFPHRTHNDKYYSILTPDPMTTMFSSRGCPYQCSYCDRPAMGSKFRARSPENVVDEMEECQRQGIKEILFYDDTFTVDKGRVIDICYEIRNRKLDVKWDVRARVDTVSRNLLSEMKESGCNRIHFGVESGVQRILDNLNKNITLEQVNNAFKWAYEADIKTLSYFMIGNPGETKEDIDESCILSKKLYTNYAQFTILTPFPATRLYSKWCEQHDKDVWKDFSLRPTQTFTPPIWDEHFTRDELRRIMSKIYRSYYFRPRSIWNKVRGVRSLSQLKRYINAGMELMK